MRRATTATAAEHPRPQFRRDQWHDLCGTWRFAFDDDDLGVEQRWFDKGQFNASIQVPYPPESKLSEINDTTFHPVVWYARDVPVPPVTSGQRTLLHFGAVDYQATVWVNGERLAEHTGGHTPFSVDITPALRTDQGSQLVVVRAEDQPTDVHQPRGKQVTAEEPRGIFYDRTTGIWQPVWMETVAETHIRGMHWTTDLEAGQVHLDLELSEAPATTWSVCVRVSRDGADVVTHAVQAAGAQVRVTLSTDALGGAGVRWSPESPTLFDAEITIEGSDPPDGDRLDRVDSYFGLRSAGYRDGIFLLNGQPYYLRMVLEQGFWPESHLAAPSAEALRREVELIKELGFNGARIHQKIEDPRFLYWCDRLGLVVWGEFPAAFGFSPKAVTRTIDEWMEAVERDRSHPCVVAWVPLNESWGVPTIATSRQQRDFATSLYHVTKALDPTRPVISNDGWEHTVSDIWSVHDYTPSGESIRRRYHTPQALDRTLHGVGPGRRSVMLLGDERAGQPVMITEFGGLAFTHELDGTWAGYSTVETIDQLTERFDELVTAIVDSPELAGFCYTQLTDTQQEKNGLLTEDRVAKIAPDVVREIVCKPSRAVPSEEVDAYRCQTRRRQP
ncbi:glycoside hydrolase family 2 [Phytoactinopolyspora halotolerans]|uniref:Glycoside hydrolase family 2 n=2 Tax=Phytoactinopolyspora halotolerans TaxID=1981512 RepID=A0A6L9S3D0_9ACTN|nr:glycoside hydrolase family 2 [Phytoactinopolyspora halotolerans]